MNSHMNMRYAQRELISRMSFAQYLFFDDINFINCAIRTQKHNTFISGIVHLISNRIIREKCIKPFYGNE